MHCAPAVCRPDVKPTAPARVCVSFHLPTGQIVHRFGSGSKHTHKKGTFVHALASPLTPCGLPHNGTTHNFRHDRRAPVSVRNITPCRAMPRASICALRAWCVVVLPPLLLCNVHIITSSCFRFGEHLRAYFRGSFARKMCTC